MFILTDDGAPYSWPVKYSRPISGGRWDELSFDAEFKRLDQDRINELVNPTASSDIKLVKEVLIGWKGVVDKAGADVPFSVDAVGKLLKHPKMASAIAMAYLESVAANKIKN
jgi:hypothetical protein